MNKFLFPSDDRTRLMILRSISMFTVRTGNWPTFRFLCEVMELQKDRLSTLLKSMPMIEIIGESVTIKLEEKKKKPRCSSNKRL